VQANQNNIEASNLNRGGIAKSRLGNEALLAVMLAHFTHKMTMLDNGKGRRARLESLAARSEISTAAFCAACQPSLRGGGRSAATLIGRSRSISATSTSRLTNGECLFSNEQNSSSRSTVQSAGARLQVRQRGGINREASPNGNLADQVRSCVSVQAVLWSLHERWRRKLERHVMSTIH
jgi:hypothetical protein